MLSIIEMIDSIVDENVNLFLGESLDVDRGVLPSNIWWMVACAGVHESASSKFGE